MGQHRNGVAKRSIIEHSSGDAVTSLGGGSNPLEK